jgi:hypothetical protein
MFVNPTRNIQQIHQRTAKPIIRPKLYGAAITN